MLVFQEEKNKYYICFVYEVKAPVYADNGLYQAFDLGVFKHTAVNMRGRFVQFRNPRFDKYWNPKLDTLQSRRDHCKKHSRRWKYLHGRLRKCRRKHRCQTRDWMHKLSGKIVGNTKANTIVVGDLNVKGIARSLKGRFQV